MSRDIVPINKNWKYKNKFKDEYINKDFVKNDFESVNLPHTNITITV
ncbi:MAG: hypothetical protein MJA31_16705 [Clostridia bacterium]|nr:hypothetical protein [Clostridia bacterium]